MDDTLVLGRVFLHEKGVMIKYFQVTVRMVMVAALSFSASIANCRANSQYCLVVAWK